MQGQKGNAGGFLPPASETRALRSPRRGPALVVCLFATACGPPGPPSPAERAAPAIVEESPPAETYSEPFAAPEEPDGKGLEPRSLERFGGNPIEVLDPLAERRAVDTSKVAPGSER